MIIIKRLSEILPTDMHYLLKDEDIEEIRITVNSRPFVKTANDHFFTNNIILGLINYITVLKLNR